MSRAIIRHPKAFLFDEPLSNLDAALRVHMRKEIRALHDRLGATSVYVTHDQVEAMTMADHVVVMRDGVIEQQGCPLELYDRPANKFVAGFIGSPAMNFLPAVGGQDGRSIIVDLGIKQTIVLDRAVQPGRALTVGLRPEHIELAVANEGVLSAQVALVESTGATSFLTMATTPELSVVFNGRSQVRAGDIVRLNFAPGSMHLFDTDTERRLSD